MIDLQIHGTTSAPAVRADRSKGVLEMRGDSYPENSFEFFKPIVGWVETYLAENDAALRLELFLLYLNTSSVKAMMDIFDMLEEAHQGGREVSVRWHYDAENERIAELAEEFKEDCTFPFEIVREASA
jgi:hypothetical protein